MKKIKIYLDHCSYNRPFDNQSQMKVRLETEAKLYIQAGIREGRYSLCWSFMSDYENSENPSEEKKKAIGFWMSKADDYCETSPDILEYAKGYLKIGLKHKDAIHLACAVKSKCDYLITADKRFYNKNDLIKEIKIVNPMTFILEMEEETK